MASLRIAWKARLYQHLIDTKRKTTGLGIKQSDLILLVSCNFSFFAGRVASLSMEPQTCVPDAVTLFQHPRKRGKEYGNTYLPTNCPNYPQLKDRSVSGILEIIWCGSPGRASLAIDGWTAHRWNTGLENPARVKVLSQAARSSNGQQRPPPPPLPPCSPHATYSLVGDFK
jgi:hypothetical protein